MSKVELFQAYLANDTNEPWSWIHVQAASCIFDVMRHSDVVSAHIMMEALERNLERLVEVDDGILVIGLVRAFTPFRWLSFLQERLAEKLSHLFEKQGWSAEEIRLELAGLELQTKP